MRLISTKTFFVSVVFTALIYAIGVLYFLDRSNERHALFETRVYQILDKSNARNDVFETRIDQLEQIKTL